MSPEQEGWYTDPWGRHEARWMSAGVPSKLVRDRDVESYDEPPDSPPMHAWTPIEPLPGSVTAADTLRADAAEAEAMPSLAELSRREESAVITTGAHPWFIARTWTRTTAAPSGPDMPAKPMSALRRTALLGGGVVTGLALLFATYLWVVAVIGMLTPPPPIWGGAIFSLVPLLAPAVVIALTWRGDGRARVPLARRLQRAEAIGGLLAILSVLLWIVSMGVNSST